MSTDKLAELEQRLAHVESELEVAREQNRSLQQRHRRTSHVRRTLFVCGLLAFGLVITMAGLPASKAQNPKIITVMEAPFEVVDKNKRTIMKVDEAGLSIFNDQGLAVVRLNALAESKGGRVIVRDGKAGNGYVQIAYPASGGVFAMKDNNDQFLAVADKDGFVWYNKNGVPAVKIGAGESGDKGLLEIADVNGIGVVEAGSTQGRRGFVRVLPNKGQVPKEVPQYMLGSKP